MDAPSEDTDMPTPEDHKLCATCGRRFSWRRKWESDWGSVKYCSDRCRRHKPGNLDAHLEQAILDLLAKRDPSSTICPSEAARAVDPEHWRDLNERTRQAARRLANDGKIRIMQKGKPIDPTNARGPIRLALNR